jgi:signal transduction histidine kinase
MRWSIRYQLLVPLLILLLGSAAISTWTALASAAHARQQIEKETRDVAHTLSESRYPLDEGVLKQIKGLSGADYLVIDAKGGRKSTFPAAAIEDVTLPAPEAVADDWQALRLGPQIVVAGQAYRCSGVRLWRRAENTSSLLYIFYPEALWRDALWKAVRPSLLLGGFVGLAAVALAVGVGQRLGRRIQELERRTRQIAAGDFTPLPLSGGNDELRDLARSINDMAQQLARLQEAAKQTERLRLLGQVGGGLAHQLRNAVTGARLAVQLHARGCTSGDPEALDVALRQLALIEANLKRFLDLGRPPDGRREPCSLVALLTDAVTLLQPRCKHAGIDLRWQPTEADGTVLGDADQLGQLFLNVLGNAIEAAGPGGWVRVELRMADGGWRIARKESAIRHPLSAIIEVSDSGPGPPPDVAERLFEPFVTGKPEGVGLGLAVAQQAAEAHGGRIDWHRERDRTCFRIELPLQDAV